MYKEQFKKLREEYVKNVAEIIDKLTKDEKVDYFTVKLSADEICKLYGASIQEDWFQSDGDYWLDPVRINGRYWEVQGSGYDGDASFSLVFDDEDDE